MFKQSKLSKLSFTLMQLVFTLFTQLYQVTFACYQICQKSKFAIFSFAASLFETISYDRINMTNQVIFKMTDVYFEDDWTTILNLKLVFNIAEIPSSS